MQITIESLAKGNTFIALIGQAYLAKNEDGSWKARPASRKYYREILLSRMAQMGVFPRLDIQKEWEKARVPYPVYVTNRDDKYRLLRWTSDEDFDIIDEVAKEIRTLRVN
jgi:hypothetical protein